MVCPVVNMGNWAVKIQDKYTSKHHSNKKSESAYFIENQHSLTAEYFNPN